MKKRFIRILFFFIFAVFILQLNYLVFASTLSQAYKQKEKQITQEYQQQILQNKDQIKENLLKQYQQQALQLKQKNDKQQLSVNLKVPVNYGKQIANNVDTKLSDSDYYKVKEQMINQYTNSKKTFDKNTLSQYKKDATSTKSQYSALSKKVTETQNKKNNANSSLQNRYNSVNASGIRFNNSKYEQIKNHNDNLLKSPVAGFNSNLSSSNSNIQNANKNAYANKTLPQITTTKNYAGLDKKYNNFKQPAVPDINKKNYNNVNKQTSVQNYVAGSSKLNKMITTAQKKTKNAQKKTSTKK